MLSDEMPCSLVEMHSGEAERGGSERGRSETERDLGGGRAGGAEPARPEPKSRVVSADTAETPLVALEQASRSASATHFIREYERSLQNDGEACAPCNIAFFAWPRVCPQRHSPAPA